MNTAAAVDPRHAAGQRLRVSPARRREPVMRLRSPGGQANCQARARSSDMVLGDKYGFRRRDDFLPAQS